MGGALVNRMRLACEVIAAVKERVDEKLAVIVRVACEEYGQEGGLELDEAILASQLFEQAGADAIHVTVWGRYPRRLNIRLTGDHWYCLREPGAGSAVIALGGQ